jgi:predicted Zn-dependent peptidase
MKVKTFPFVPQEVLRELKLEPKWDLEYKRLHNGILLAQIRDTKSSRSWLRIQFALGSCSESKERNGITHLLEHMLFRGCEPFKEPSDLEAAFETIGGTANAFVDTERTCFHTHCYPRFILESLELFRVMFQAPLFSDLETEKRVIIQEILEDKNEQGEEIDPENLLYALMFPDAGLALPIAGSVANVEQFCRQDLIERLKELLWPKKTLVMVSGDTDFRFFEESLEEGFQVKIHDRPGSISPQVMPAYSLDSPGPKLLIRHNTQSLYEVCLGFQTPGPDHPHMFKLPVLLRLLTGMGKSILTRRLREERGLVYSLDASLNLHKGLGVFIVEFATQKESIMEALKNVFVELENLKGMDIPQQLLEMARLNCLYDLYFEQDNPESVLEHFAKTALFDLPWLPQEAYRALLETTPEDIRTLSKDIFCKAGLHLILVGPYFNGQSNLEFGILKEIETIFHGS